MAETKSVTGYYAVSRGLHDDGRTCDCSLGPVSLDNALFQEGWSRPPYGVSKAARIRSFMARALGRRKRQPMIAQTLSPLLCLPLEVREIIWDYALMLPFKAKPHFHVYDRVYDSCTYEPLSSCMKLFRGLATRTSLLRTCRGVYEEAVQFLYNDVHFELVLFGGSVRPANLIHPYAWNPSRKNLEDRHSLGTIKKCPQIQRMRHVTVVLQPGQHPLLFRYEARMASLIRMFGRNPKLSSLCVKTNFGYYMDDDEEAMPLLRSLITLLKSVDLSPSCCLSLNIGRCSKVRPDWGYSMIERCKVDLGLSDAQILYWPQVDKLGQLGVCLHRGAFTVNKFRPRMPPPSNLSEQLKACAAYGTLALVSPVLVPVMLVREALVSARKGEKRFLPRPRS